ncbi:hypothetical protein [Halomonas sp. M4R1S46]|uniref:hypothetical protein n=1 Tax=Halomonas sp. M4R1S46 TaxID=2982692 RepID=UPI0021E432AA|nr:hypothetical protein [Halomonas sp. M4R1S46]UYG06680.1 hypothetical protein OCT48_13740 [Halomonas sp. M4R1S46]
MKLILKQYLSGLKERSELDAILPCLLSQMGLNVFISPTRGVKEYGVDIAAVGKIGDAQEKVYLFSVKAGNLTRSTWSGNTDQALRPSLDEILDAFIPSRIPPEHKTKPIVICMCFGGDVSSGIRQEVTGYTSRMSNDSLNFEEWNGDKLSDLIIENLLQQELLPNDWQSLLRKSLALLDEPQASHIHFQRLVREILNGIDDDTDKITRSLNCVNLCLWVLFSWCREGRNLESAYLSAEFSALYAWRVRKASSKTKVVSAYEGLLETYNKITNNFLDECIIPFVDQQHAISVAVNSPCSIDINLKLFDLLGRLAVKGQWLLHHLSQNYIKNPPTNGENQEQEAIRKELESTTRSIKLMVVNNPALLSPYSDSQAIEIFLAVHLLTQNSDHDIFVKDWLEHLVDRSTFSYKTNSMYPCNLYTYEQLLSHKNLEEHTASYKEKITRGSILYPTLLLFSELHQQNSLSQSIEKFIREELSHCTLQYWHPNSSSEENLYTNTSAHGSSSVINDPSAKAVIEHCYEDCKHSSDFWQLSAVKNGYLPLTLIASRYYRHPVPLHILEPLLEDYLTG